MASMQHDLTEEEQQFSMGMPGIEEGFQVTAETIWKWFL
jgi:hypothetical protein